MSESPPEARHNDQRAESQQIALEDAEPSPPLPELCAQIHEKVETFLSAETGDERIKATQSQSRISLGVIEEALGRYSQDEISLSYNGGKDCLVLLILYLTALHSHYSKQTSSTTTNNSTNHNHHTRSSSNGIPDKLESVHIITKHPFKAINDFVNFSVTKYHLNLTHSRKPMREAFADYLHDHPQVKAIFVGTRRTDPHGGSLTHFDLTDRGWPNFMRIHPVIDWHYAEIWTFIREMDMEYCKLYDLGYTSLGGRTDTHPNPALAVREGEGEGMQDRWGGEGKFRPAYELIEDKEERLGRDH